MSHHSLSVSIPTSPELSPSQSPTDTDSTRTNTLVVTSLPPSFFQPLILDALRNHFASYGEVHTWAPLKAFARAILIYYDEEAAELAKEHSDSLVIGPIGDIPQTILRVYRGVPTILVDPSGKPNNQYLRPPELEKNFLISPPGSPPVGWEQVREEPPNSSPLAHDLIEALKRLELQRQHHERHHQTGIEVLIDPDEGAGIGVYVEDCDPDSEDEDEDEDGMDWAYGQASPSRMKWQPERTAMPPPMAVGA